MMKPIDDEQREKYMEACGGFGMDENGRTGFSETDPDCLRCLKADDVSMYAACQAEYKAWQAKRKESPAEPADAGEVRAEPEEPPAAEQPEGKEKGDDEMAKKTGKAKPKAAKKEKKPSRLSLGQAVMDLILKTRSAGKFRRADILAAAMKTPAAKGRTDSAVACQVGFAILYGLRFDILKRDGSSRGLVLWV